MIRASTGCAAEKDSENLIGDEAADADDSDSVEANPSRRHRRYDLDADRRPRSDTPLAMSDAAADCPEIRLTRAGRSSYSAEPLRGAEAPDAVNLRRRIPPVDLCCLANGR